MIEQELIVERTAEFVRSAIEGESSGHDWWHLVRVRRLTVELAQKEEANPFSCQMAALLHDLADKKFYQLT